MKFQIFANLFVSFLSLLFLMTSSVLGAEDLTQSVFEECGSFPRVETRRRCYRENLSAIMRKEGTLMALQVLEQLYLSHPPSQSVLFDLREFLELILQRIGN